MKRIQLILLIGSLLTTSLSAQNEPIFNIKDPGDNKAKRCHDYTEVIANMPPEVRYTVHEENRYLYLIFGSRAYFDLIFDHKADGFAIDILHKDQYQCGQPNAFANSWANKGRLMPPMYKETFTPLIKEWPNGTMIVNYGKLPEDLDPKEVEYNLLIIQKNWLCDNQYFYNIDFDTWSLLPMGLYRDSIQNPEALPYRDLQKTMYFNVPFEKDQTAFQEADVQPIRDSLNLTDFLIKTIDIKAYSSVEGPLDRNIRLQEGRAQSIVDILKGYQNESITSQISASENWAEFNRDIKGTEFEELATLEHRVVKNRLSSDKNLLSRLEPLLGQHRKAEITITLDKKVNPRTGSPELLKRLFGESLEQEKLDEALYLQEVAFERIKSQEFPESYLGELIIPERAAYGSLLSNRAIFQAELQPDNLAQSVEAFEKLLNLLPGNKQVQYNLAVMRVRKWAVVEQAGDRRSIQNLINKVAQSGLSDDLVRNLRVNYNIILTKYFHDVGNYAQKNRSLRMIFNEYRRVKLADEQLLRLAKFMTHYSRFDWAQALLENRVIEEDASADVIFYYLNLTIADTRNTRKPQYQQVLDNAVKMDKVRFCSLFKPKPQGGITFQLLGDNNLKKKFCQECSTVDPAVIEARH